VAYEQVQSILYSRLPTVVVGPIVVVIGVTGQMALIVCASWVSDVFEKTSSEKEDRVDWQTPLPSGHCPMRTEYRPEVDACRRVNQLMLSCVYQWNYADNDLNTFSLFSTNLKRLSPRYRIGKTIVIPTGAD